MTIGKKLKEFREELNVSAIQLAKNAKISSTLLSLYEKEARLPTRQNLENLLYQLALVASEIPQPILAPNSEQNVQKPLEDMLTNIILACRDNLEQMPSKEELLYQSLCSTTAKKIIQRHDNNREYLSLRTILRENPEIVADLEDLRRIKFLQLDDEPLNPNERMNLLLIIDLIRLKRQQRRQREEDRERRYREHPERFSHTQSLD